MANAPLIVDNYPRSVVSDPNSDAGKLEASVQKWAQEVYQAMQNLSNSVQTLLNAPRNTATTAAVATESVTQIVSTAGANGWTPVFALIPFGGGIIMELQSWSGGTGAAPTTTPLYVGPAGFTPSPSSATNLLGPTGSAGGYQYIFSAGLTAPPASGDILFDSATFGTIANVQLSTTDRNGADVSATMAKIGIGSVLEVYQEGSSIAFATFAVTAVTSHSGYLTLGVTPLSGQVLTDLQAVGFSFSGGGGTSGAAGGALTNTYPNPDTNPAYNAIFASLTAGISGILDNGAFSVVPNKTTGVTGTTNIPFDLYGTQVMTLSGNATFTTSGLAAGRLVQLFLLNPTGGAFTLSWPAWIVANGTTLPASIPAATTFQVFLFSSATANAGVIAIFPSSSSGGSGTVTSITAGTGLNVGAGPGGSISTSGTLNLANTAVTAGKYYRATVTVDAQGRLTAASSDPDFVNVKDYGVTGNGSTDDTANITTAIAALTGAGNTKGTLYFPDGVYLISNELALSLSGYNTFTIKGNGRFSSIILQTVGGKNGFTVTIAQAGSNNAEARCEVCDLGFQVAAGIQAGDAVHITYGSTATASSEAAAGLQVSRLDIGPVTYGGTGGWTNGVFLYNPWLFGVSDIFGVGFANTNLVPTSGVGSGSLVIVFGGVNGMIHKINGSFWQEGISLQPAPLGGGHTASQQGIMISNVVLVAVKVGLHLYPGFAFSNIQVVNCLVDQGNSPNAGLANVAYYLDGDPSNSRGECTFTACSWTQVTGVATSCAFLLNNINRSMFQGCIGDASGTSGAVVLTGTSTNNVFNGCNYNGFAITCGNSCSGNQFNNTGTSTFTAGTGVPANTNKTTMF